MPTHRNFYYHVGGWSDRRTDRRTVGRLDGRMDRQKDGQPVGRTTGVGVDIKERQETKFRGHWVLLHTKPLDTPSAPFGKTISSHQCHFWADPRPWIWCWCGHDLVDFPLILHQSCWNPQGTCSKKSGWGRRSAAGGRLCLEHPKPTKMQQHWTQINKGQ